MSSKIKNIIIAGMLFLVTLPFLLITDIFPFLRFGMFAEPVRTEKQMELFEVSYLDSSMNERTLNPEMVGIEPHFFLYIARNYYYRKETDKFLKNISRLSSDINASEWRMKKIILSKNKEQEADTTIVAKLYEK